MTGETLLIRADASPRIGTGHVMRCLALAQAWQDEGGHCIFITAATGDALLDRLREEGFEVRPLESPFPDPADLALTRQVIAENRDAWLVLDGYHFDATYQQALRESGARLLVIDDDGHLPTYRADLILNQNLHAQKVRYDAPGAQLLLGTRFALLRREFRTWEAWKRVVPDRGRKVLVTMGGADPDNVTLKVIRALGLIKGEGWEAAVVVGASNPHFAVLEKAARECRCLVRLERAVRDMPALMAWADIAVSAAGSTCWELCFMGLPSLVVVLADNQVELARGMDALGTGVSAGWYGDLDSSTLAENLMALADAPARRASFSRAGQDLVDGRGSRRTVERFHEAMLSLTAV